MNANLYSLFESRFPADRDQPLLLLEDGGRVTYRDAHEGSGRLAALLAQCGVQPGDRVAVQVEKSPEALLLYLACLRVGAAYLPLNSAYQQGEVGYFLGNAQPTVVVAQPKSIPWLEPLAVEQGVGSVFTLDEQGKGSLAEMAAGMPATFATVEPAKSSIARLASKRGWNRIAVPLSSTQWQATKRPCTWKRGSMWISTSSGPNPHAACRTAAFEARLRCVIIAPLERPVVPEV